MEATQAVARMEELTLSPAAASPETAERAKRMIAEAKAKVKFYQI